MSYLLIDDSNWQDHVGIAGHGYGLIPRDWDKVQYGSVGDYAGPVPLPLIPESEWKDRIADMERTKSSLTHIIDDVGVPCLNQGSVGYCHAFSPAHAAMCLRATMNQPFSLLSASSVGGPVTGYRNQGAWILDDLKQAANVGFAEEKFYPMLTTRNSWTPEGQASAARNRIAFWWEMKRRNMNEVMTALLSRIPVCVGLNWWGHAVTYLKPVIQSNGTIAILFQNSWGEQYGGMGNGRALLSWSKAIPDESYSPWQVTPSLSS